MENLTLAGATGTAAPGGEIITRKRQRLAHSAKMKKFYVPNLGCAVTRLFTGNEQTGQRVWHPTTSLRTLRAKAAVAMQPLFRNGALNLTYS